jgi:transcriptional regulator with XRE-family HTH domain
MIVFKKTIAMRFIIGLIIELIFGFENKWSRLDFFHPKWKNPERELSIGDRRRIGRGLKAFREKRNRTIESFATAVPIGIERLREIETGVSTATDEELALISPAIGEFIPQLYYYEIDDLDHRTFENRDLRKKSRKVFKRGEDIHHRIIKIGRFSTRRPRQTHFIGYDIC